MKDAGNRPQSLLGKSFLLLGPLLALLASDTGASGTGNEKCLDGFEYTTDSRGWETRVARGGQGCSASQKGRESQGGGGGGGGGLDLLFWPLSPREVAELWEAGPRVIRRGDAGHFSRALALTGESVEAVLLSAVAVNGTGSEPMKNGAGGDGNDFRLVKRVRGKDGEWWSGGAPGETIDGQTIASWVRRKGFTLVLNHLDMRHPGVARSRRPVQLKASQTLFNSLSPCTPSLFFFSCLCHT